MRAYDVKLNRANWCCNISPAGAALNPIRMTEWCAGHHCQPPQWALAEITDAVISVGLDLVHVSEYPEPFFRPSGVSAAVKREIADALQLAATRLPSSRTPAHWVTHFATRAAPKNAC